MLFIFLLYFSIKLFHWYSNYGMFGKRLWFWLEFEAICRKLRLLTDLTVFVSGIILFILFRFSGMSLLFFFDIFLVTLFGLFMNATFHFTSTLSVRVWFLFNAAFLRLSLLLNLFSTRFWNIRFFFLLDWNIIVLQNFLAWLFFFKVLLKRIWNSE